MTSIFTSGGTEANQLALRGFPDRRLIVSAIEHDSVLAAAPDAARLPVTGDGRADLAALDRMLAADPRPALVSLMLANNETGAIQPVAEAAAIAHRHGALLHCDAIQASGKYPFNFSDSTADLMTLSAHKIGGPMGVGALVASPGPAAAAARRPAAGRSAAAAPAPRICPASPASAPRDAAANSRAACAPSPRCATRAERRLLAIAPDARIFALTRRACPTRSASPCRASPPSTQVMALDLAGVMVSAGAACSSGKVRRSQVLDAMGVPPDDRRMRHPHQPGLEHDRGRHRPTRRGLGRALCPHAERTRVRDANRPPIYLDYQATTPCDPRVVAAMLPWFTEKFGNPGSITHAFGREAEAAVERARAQLAALIGAEPREIVFTSGATEANNLAVKGAAQFHRQLGRDHIVTLATEHKCVLESGEGAGARGVPRDLPAGRAQRPGRSRGGSARARRAHRDRLGDGGA